MSPPAPSRPILELSAVKEDSALPENAAVIAENLLKNNEACSREAHKALKTAEEAGDEVTVDMMAA